jgi:hypothetical protein
MILAGRIETCVSWETDNECNGPSEQKPHGWGQAKGLRGDANAKGDEFTKQSRNIVKR